MSIFLKKALLALAIAGVAGVAQADVVSGQSYTETGGIRVGAATGVTPAVPGAGVNGELFNSLAQTSHFAFSDYQNATTGVYNWSGRQIVADGVAPGPESPADHSGLGVWSFAKAGSDDVWYGTWSAESTSGAAGTKVAGTHTAWYVGEDGNVATTLPATATYTVRSINNSTQTATSVLSATFNGGSNGTASSTGDIAFTGGSINTVGNDVRLAASSVAITSNGGSGGTLNGNFYGTGASSVAGIVTFANRNLNTAFGGAKN